MALFEIVTHVLEREDLARRDAREGKERFFYDSNAGGCLRQRVLRRADTPTFPMRAADLLAFKVGNLFHDWVRERLLQAGAIPVVGGTALTEQSVNDGSSHGRYDFLVKDGDRYLLVDLKSISSFGFKKRLEEGVDLAYAMQLTRYYLKLKDQYDIARGIIWFLNKDPKPGLTDLECPVTFDEALIRQTTEDIQAEQTAWQTYLTTQALPDMLPLEPKGKTNWRCQYCSMVQSCPGREAGNKYTGGSNGN